MILRVLAIVTGLTLGWGYGTPFAHGQKATEMFIPVGQSPGLSNTVTVIGTIEAVDPRARTVAVKASGGSWSAAITDRTAIWLDRSKLRLTNQKGTFADLKEGLLIEVKYADPEGKSRGSGPAEWVKVQLTEASAPPGERRR